MGFMREPCPQGPLRSCKFSVHQTFVFRAPLVRLAEPAPRPCFSVRKICPEIYCLPYGQAIEAGHADRLRSRLDRRPEPGPATRCSEARQVQKNLRGKGK